MCGIEYSSKVHHSKQLRCVYNLYMYYVGTYVHAYFKHREPKVIHM